MKISWIKKNQKMIKKTLILIGFIIIAIFVGNYRRYLELNSELNKLGYNQYNNEYIIKRSELKGMRKLIKEALPPQDLYTYIFPVNYELLGGNLEKNYRDSDLKVEDMWYVMFQDYKGLTPVMKKMNCSNKGDYTYSVKKNYYESIFCENEIYEYSITFGLYEYPYATEVGIKKKTGELNYVDFSNGESKIIQHDDKIISDEEIELWIKEFEEFTVEMYEEYLNVIGR